MREHFAVQCPYCGEAVEVFLEAELEGELVQDCEVCCNPWQLHIWHEGGERQLRVSRTDGSE